MKVLVTCPPMLQMIDHFRPLFAEKKVELLAPNITQTMTEAELEEILPTVNGWIIGDDPATRRVFTAGKNGNLRAAVKWGIGVDNVDFVAAKDLDIPIDNTPKMFGSEVADVAMGYVLGLARELFVIDRGVRNNQWPKPAGESLTDKSVALIGFGDIGKNVAKRLKAFDMKVIAYDPGFTKSDIDGVTIAKWPERIAEADYMIFTCALNKHNKHMLNQDVFSKAKPGVKVVNVARGPLIDESALINNLKSGHVSSAALDVFENEPLAHNSELREFNQCIFGSHNGSNTKEAVIRASHDAIRKLFHFLKIS